MDTLVPGRIYGDAFFYRNPIRAEFIAEHPTECIILTISDYEHFLNVSSNNLPSNIGDRCNKANKNEQVF